ncbi:hypothetical protein [Pseudosulfitobacter pseudonitzschiae]|uniref:hypothetical protein n=1 Tax=Pseudosulfitobacter pseudonitzschiae TaxID=1402135 RepID=UPI003B78E7B3
MAEQMDNTYRMPEILEQPLIPPPLHGLNPRNIMGRTAWDILRKEIYARHGYTCAACGVYSRRAILKRGLEAHERYEIDYPGKRMVVTGMEPLCHACHCFVHSGLLEVRLAKRQVSAETVAIILGHGSGVLKGSGGKMPPGADLLCRKLKLKHDLKVQRHPPRLTWPGWVLEWEGETYPSLYPSEAAWKKAMRSL